MERARVFEAVLVIILICLAGLLFFAVTSAGPSPPGWEQQTNGTIDYMFVGSNDTLYTFEGNTISALKSDGNLVWRTVIPGKWKVLSNLTGLGVLTKDSGHMPLIPSSPVVAERSGHLYLFVYRQITEGDIERARADPNMTFTLPIELMAVSPEGQIEWETPLDGYNVTGLDILGLTGPENFDIEGMATLTERDGRLYLYREYREDVFGNNGTLLFTIGNVSGPAAVGDDGWLYLIPATWPPAMYNLSFYENRPNDTVIVGEDVTRLFFDPEYLTSGSSVDAYGPDGSLRWSTDLGDRVIRSMTNYHVWPKYSSLPLYWNGTLYVPVSNGLASLDTHGKINWISRATGGTFILFPLMPLDDRGNVYMSKLEYPSQTSDMLIISGDGKVSDASWPYMLYDVPDSGQPGLVAVAGSKGVIYAYNSNVHIDLNVFEKILSSKDFPSDTITAYDVRNNTARWNFTVPSADKHTMLLTKETIAQVGLEGSVLDEHSSGIVFVTPLDQVPITPSYRGIIVVYPGENVTYVSYHYQVLELPVIANRSRCLYIDSLYALDNDGYMLWRQPIASNIYRAVANNSSFYYSTWDGRVGSKSAGIAAAGIAIAAAVYVFFRFFMLGTVARAKGLIDKNENRRQVLRYVADNPGMTAAEAARSLDINLGTVRYHLFILALNHKVIAHNEGDKFLRYFTNAGAYSQQERSLVSLMRRDTLRRMLVVLSRRPGITGPELARELNVSTTAAHRHISELAEKGIVERTAGDDNSYAYSIKEEYRPHVMRIMDRL
ncbi:MAG: winged helix-turn-helix transcriptional regulator [Methanocella sp.]